MFAAPRRLLPLARLTVPLCLALCLANAAQAHENAPTRELALLRDHLQASLEAMDQALARAAGELAGTGLIGPEASAVLSRLCAAEPLAIDCSCIDRLGVMVLVEPSDFKMVEGSDISDQPQVAHIMRTAQPVLSGMFRTVEGVHAVDLERPVLDKDGAYLGSVSVIFDPAHLVRKALAGSPAGVAGGPYLLQADGLVLHDPDPEGIGRVADDPGRLATHWLEIGLHGATWRLGMGRP